MPAMLLESRLTFWSNVSIFFWDVLFESLFLAGSVTAPPPEKKNLFENPQESSRKVSQTKNQCLRTVGGDALSECSLLFLPCLSESAFSPHISSTFSIFQCLHDESAVLLGQRQYSEPVSPSSRQYEVKVVSLSQGWYDSCALELTHFQGPTPGLAPWCALGATEVGTVIICCPWVRDIVMSPSLKVSDCWQRALICFPVAQSQ